MGLLTKKIAGLLYLVCILFTLLSCNAPVKVLFITGGHDYDKENFNALLAKLPISYDHIEHPDALSMLKVDQIAKYDVVLLYDMPKEISPEAQQDFIAMLQNGKGLVALHHAFCSYDLWPEYAKIIGGRYHHFPWTKEGIVQKPSTYTHDVALKVRVEDKNHPVTNGISDFEIFDEAYGGTEIRPTVHPVLSTDDPSSGPLVCWTNMYGRSRVVALTLGHDIKAWENPSFIKTLSQAIVWAKKIEPSHGDNEPAAYEIAAPLPRSTPQAEKVSRRGITNYLEAVKNSGQDIHSVMIVRHGKVVTEQWFGNNAPDKLHALWSVSKTYTATAIGFAVSENRLKVTDKVISFFPDKLPPEVSPNLQALEVRHLLTMSVGNEENEVNRARRGENADWVQAFLSAPLDIEPGTEMRYNSMATYMLSAIITKVTGEKLIDYLTPRLFLPLGITGITWDESPQGINVGGWGLNVKTEDMAKLGQFFLQKGKWDGKQLLPESWIEEATKSHIASLPAGTRRENLKMKPEDSDWLQGYGYQMWRCRHNGVRADGANGQYIIILPEKDAVIAVTANVSDMQAEINLIWEHLLTSFE